jgi:hypothetical protein
MRPTVDVADQAADRFEAVTAVHLRGVWASMKHGLLRCGIRERRDRQVLLHTRTPGQPRTGVFCRWGADSRQCGVAAAESGLVTVDSTDVESGAGRTSLPDSCS